MARITPKTNWVANDIPTAQDFNRIENNNQQAFDDVDNLGNVETTWTELQTFTQGISVAQINPISSAGVQIGGLTFVGGGIVGSVWGA
jgi:hypothetical protein